MAGDAVVGAPAFHLNVGLGFEPCQAAMAPIRQRGAATLPSMRAEPTIVCVDCGGVCHLISVPPPDAEFEPGDVVAYRCEDCRDRWDLVLPESDDAAPADGWRG